MGNGKGSELRQRCLVFATDVLRFADESDPRGPARWTVFKQLCGSAASIGANLEEADAAQSRADFISKCCISLKEARETRYWLRLIQRTFFPHREDDLHPLIQEATELIAILTTIIRKASSHRIRS
ncbi:MAG: four helix bundle protein [Thermoanaerobaculia bacterium]|nr:four helix bundle protein [Thermoanaerobaculia bacterium]